jgi:hypothetical protein
MIPIVDISNYVESEFKIKRDEMRRTRSWIDGANQVSDERWYQAKATYKLPPSIFDRLSGLMKIRRQTVGSKS